MSSTHAYLSAKVWLDDVHVSHSARAMLVPVKAHTYSAAVGGWCYDAHERLVIPVSLSTWGIVKAKTNLREKACSTAREVTEEVFRDFACLSVVAVVAHGDHYPTWVGDLYIEPVFVTRGTARKRHLSHYLVTEAPGLDCGHWEEDPLPLGGG